MYLVPPVKGSEYPGPAEEVGGTAWLGLTYLPAPVNGSLNAAAPRDGTELDEGVYLVAPIVMVR